MENGTVDSAYIKSITDGWAERFGVTVLIDSLTTEEFEKALDNGDYQIAIYTLTAEDDRPYSFLSTFLSANEFFNYSNLEVDTILKYSQQSLSTQELLNEYSQIEKSILNEKVFVPLYYKKNYLICSSGTDNVDYDPFNHTLNFSYALNYNQED
jgi:ABC-type oligopeptide transport system substrate-binding subunit